MNKLVKKWKSIYGYLRYGWTVVRLFPQYLFDMAFHLFRFLPKTDKKIVFTFEDDNMFGGLHNNGREAYYVLKSFSDGGYNVYLCRQSDFKSYYRLREFGRLIYAIKNLKFISRIPKDTPRYIYGFDTIRSDFLKMEWKKIIYVNIRKATTFKIGNTIPMPFFMLPAILASGAAEDLERYRHLERTCRIFFAGNFSPIYYNSPIFKQKYPHLMTRLEELAVLSDSDIDIQFIKNKADFRAFNRKIKYSNKVTILQKGYDGLDYPIKPKHWLEIVGKSDFFICFSGTDYPICHNAIEAMAVGTIPILAYADWFDPPLKDGENALVYSGKEGLVQKVKQALLMSDDEVHKIRKGALEYYDNYLAESYLARKYEKNAQQASTLMLFPRLVSTAQEDAGGHEFVKKIEKHILFK